MSTQNGEKDGGAPAWLFSFLDLAFLMLIAMTMVPIADEDAPDLGDMIVPRIAEEASQALASENASEAWQLRVHPPSQYDDGSLEPPFELLLGGSVATGTEADMLDKDGLRERLALLHGKGAAKPLLAPHEDSRSQDLLDAAGLIEEYWPSSRRVLVARLMADQ